MTKKIERFLAEQRPATPCLIMDLDVVADNYRRLRHAVPFNPRGVAARGVRRKNRLV